MPDRASSSSTTSGRLEALRGQMAQAGVEGYLVPSTDMYLGEYTPPCDRRLEWMTGFSGSAGLLFVHPRKAALLTDGRYTLQARQQVDLSLVDVVPFNRPALEEWLIRTSCPEGLCAGYDPWVCAQGPLRLVEGALSRVGGTLTPLEHNLVDALWTDRPARPCSPLVLHPLAFSGQDTLDKRQSVIRTLHPDAHCAVITDPCSLAWVLNIRASDLPHTPVALAWGLVHRDGWIDFFLDSPHRPASFPREELPQTRWHAREDFPEALARMAREGLTLHVDADHSPVGVLQWLEKHKASVVRGMDPCLVPKACKNTTEVAGARSAHSKDGVAVVRFLAWLEHTLNQGQTITELEAVDQLEHFRQQQPGYHGPSFDTIAASGPHGAVVHYKPSPQTSRVLAPGDLFLLDSGGQYPEGTTDITRTVAIGQPSELQRLHFTCVLNGHIALAQAVFPEGTEGSRLDVLDRQPLWAIGWDYRHGTGHGVGSFLGVHEGPQNISTTPGKAGLQAGMILSNEPGLYKEGAWGIRIENLLAVVPAPVPAPEGAWQTMLAFETLTLAPIDLRCIDPGRLLPHEILWLNHYHQNVRAALAPALDAEAALWLEKSTRPLPVP